MKNEYIDSIASFSKLGIETTQWTQDKKELAKSGVDCLSAMLKLIPVTPKQNAINIMGLSFEQIKGIKEIARQCNVDKVVLFPYPNGQSVLSLVRVYGGNRELFFMRNGWSQLQANDYSDFSSELDAFEAEYGIIIYENTVR